MHRAWEEIYQNINNFSVWNYVFSSTFLYFPNCHARTSYFSDQENKKDLFCFVFEWNRSSSWPSPPKCENSVAQHRVRSWEHTTPLSQMTLMRSWTPVTPWGILVKSSLPIAFCFVVKGRWSDATMFKVSLGKEKDMTSKGRGGQGPRGWGQGKSLCLGTWQSWFQSPLWYFRAVWSLMS